MISGVRRRMWRIRMRRRITWGKMRIRIRRRRKRRKRKRKRSRMTKTW